MASNRFDEQTRQAIAEASASYDKNKARQRENKVRGAFDYVLDGIRLLLTLAALGVAALLVDGARREWNEYSATLAAFKPQVSVRRGASTKLPVKEAMSLQNRDAITTAATGTVRQRPAGSTTRW